jgi:hypothetical protein
MKEEAIINRVDASGLITFNLEDYYHPGDRMIYDIKDNLFQETILKEKDFRSFVKEHNWAAYTDKNVAITCSVEAIVPTWAYMLIASKLSPYVHMAVFGDLNTLEEALFNKALSNVEPESFAGAKVVIKGCSKYEVPVYAYVEIIRLLRPHAASIMYGEPCSTVPIYKKPK